MPLLKPRNVPRLLSESLYSFAVMLQQVLGTACTMQSCALLSSAGSIAVTQPWRGNVLVPGTSLQVGSLWVLLWGGGLAWLWGLRLSVWWGWVEAGRFRSPWASIPAIKLLLGLGSKGHKNMSFCRIGGAKHVCDICRWFWESLSPNAFSQVTVRKMKDEFSWAHIYSPSSSPRCLRRLLILPQAKESIEQTSIRWR